MRLTRRNALLGFVALVIASAALVAMLVALPGSAARAARPATTATCALAGTQLENAGFESPNIPDGNIISTGQEHIPGWSTTATDTLIELWDADHDNLVLAAAEGRQFAELNAEQVAALYQDIQTTPGTVLTWGLSHRGRLGADSMRVLIGEPGGVLVQSGPTLTDGTSAWGRHSGSYTVPAGQTCTRFQFESVASVGGPTVGNFLDAISFGTPAELEIDTTVSPTGEVNVGDTLTYDIAVSNVGGSATVNAVVSNALPDHLTFVPGSGRIIRGATETVLADAIYNGDARTVSSQVSSTSGAAGVIEPGDTVTLRYQVTVNSGAGGTVVENSPVVTGTDARGVIVTTPSPPIVTTVNTTADTTIFLEATDTAQPGDPVEYTATARNLGPQPALIGPLGEPAVTMVITLPAQVTMTPGALPVGCSAVGQVVTCTRDTTLGVYAGSVITDWAVTIAGTVNGDAGAGVATATAQATTSTFDHELGNNTTSASTGITLPLPATLSVVEVITTPIVTAGENGAYQVVVSNVGDFATNAVTLTDTIPTGFTVTTATATSGSCTIGATISCALGPIAPGGSVTVSVAGATAASLPAGSSLPNLATATDGTTTDTATDSISIQAASALVLAKGTTSAAVADQPLTYEVVVTNLGPSDAVNALVEDDLPAGTTLISTPPGCTATGLHMECTIGTIAAGANTTLTYQVQPPADGGSITNSASVSSDSVAIDPDGAADEVTTEVATDADIEVTHTSDRSTVISGDTARLFITVTNHGPMAATNVVVQASRTTGIAYVADSASAAAGSVTPTEDVFWTIGNLAVDASVQAYIDVTVTGDPGIYTHTVTASATQEDLGAVNDSALVALTIPQPEPPPETDGGTGSDAATGPGTAVGAYEGMGARLAETGEESGPLTTLGLVFLVLGVALLRTSRMALPPRARRRPRCLP